MRQVRMHPGPIHRRKSGVAGWVVLAAVVLASGIAIGAVAYSQAQTREDVTRADADIDYARDALINELWARMDRAVSDAESSGLAYSDQVKHVRGPDGKTNYQRTVESERTCRDIVERYRAELRDIHQRESHRSRDACIGILRQEIVARWETER